LKSVVVLQARTNSSRLPGKVLLPISSIPLVVLAAKRAANTGKEVIVATSSEHTDDGLAFIVESHGLTCYRGSLENTLDRMVKALSSYDDDTIIFRLTADNIFPDGSLLDDIEQDFLAKKLDYLCCNGEASGLPYGMSAEVTRLGHLREAAKNCENPYDQEHVTPYVIRKFGAQYFEKYKNLQKGHFRCTIDCLEDYLCAVKVFTDVSDPVFASSFDLITKLQYCRYQPIERKPVPRLVFGAAQLGMSYGIANTTGHPSNKTSLELIKTAIANGVTYIDTARVYGNSEEVIGLALKGGWEGRISIITKLSTLSECPSDASQATVKSFVDASVFQSLSALCTKCIDVLMLHRASHLFDWNGSAFKRILELKEHKVIKEIGVSVQNPEELEQVLSIGEISFIQMPFNLLDWRWDYIIPQIRSAKSDRLLTIHVRSALLQGLLPSTTINHWLKANINNPDIVIQWMRDQVKSCNRLDTTDLCFSYVNAMDWIDGITVGMENMEQLLDNIKYFNFPGLSTFEIHEIHKSRPKLENAALNPALWGKVQE